MAATAPCSPSLPRPVAPPPSRPRPAPASAHRARRAPGPALRPLRPRRRREGRGSYEADGYSVFPDPSRAHHRHPRHGQDRRGLRCYGGPDAAPVVSAVPPFAHHRHVRRRSRCQSGCWPPPGIRSCSGTLSARPADQPLLAMPRPAVRFSGRAENPVAGHPAQIRNRRRAAGCCRRQTPFVRRFCAACWNAPAKHAAPDARIEGVLVRKATQGRRSSASWESIATRCSVRSRCSAWAASSSKS